MSHDEDELCQAQAKVIQVEAMEHLMGSTAYQDQIQAVERELGGGGEPGDEGTLFESLGGGDPEEWSDVEATYADIKPNIKKEGSTGDCPVRKAVTQAEQQVLECQRQAHNRNTISPAETEARGSSQGGKKWIHEAPDNQGRGSTTGLDPMLVEIRDALKTMAAAFNTVASQVNGASPPQVMTTHRESASKLVMVHSSDGESGSDDAYS